MNFNLEDWQNKKIGLVGLGKSNLALAKFLVQNNILPIFGLDHKEASQLPLINHFRKFCRGFYLGESYLDKLSQFDILFLSPAVPRHLPPFRQFVRQGGYLSSEIELFFELCPCLIVGVTGTNGKSTVTSLVGQLLQDLVNKKRYSYLLVGGNLGEPVIDKLKKLDKESLVVLELSSFQLEGLTKSPHISLWLNLTQDHLDRHLSFQNYAESKKNIFKYQKSDDFAILNFDDQYLFSLKKEVPGQVLGFSCRKKLKKGAYLEDGFLKVSWQGKIYQVIKASDFHLPGWHNISNALAAILVAFILGVDLKKIRQVLLQFKGLEHRLELVREVRGVRYYNDSKATTPESTIAALQSFNQPIILIAGGYDKHLDFQNLAQEIVKSSTKRVILLGQTKNLIAQAIDQALKKVKRSPTLMIDKVESLKEAIDLVQSQAQKGDLVLFSPACASFDMFKNFEERGKIFKNLVGNL